MSEPPYPTALPLPRWHYGLFSGIGRSKTEQVQRRAMRWDVREELKLANARWVAWFNRDRLHEQLGYFTPVEIEAAYVHQQGLPRQPA